MFEHGETLPCYTKPIFMKIPQNVKAFLFDLDGTLYFRGAQIPGAAEALDELRKRGYKLRFLTNTDSIPESDILDRMTQNGIIAEKHEVFSPVTAVRNFFTNNPALTCYCLVTDKVAQALQGLNYNNQNPDYVVIGDFRDKVSYDQIDKVFRMIHSGAKVLCTNKGKLFFKEDGPHIDTGAFVTMFEYATGAESQLLGKPTAGFFNLALDNLGITKDEAVVVGDDIGVDVGGAKNIGSLSVLVKTGKYTEDVVEKTGIHPDFIIDSIASIRDILS